MESRPNLAWEREQVRLLHTQLGDLTPEIRYLAATQAPINPPREQLSPAAKMPALTALWKSLAIAIPCTIPWKEAGRPAGELSKGGRDGGYCHSPTTCSRCGENVHLVAKLSQTPTSFTGRLYYSFCNAIIQSQGTLNCNCTSHNCRAH